jgi:hypothetical protein
MRLAAGGFVNGRGINGYDDNNGICLFAPRMDGIDEANILW